MLVYHFSRKIWNPPQNEILDTPLQFTIFLMCLGRQLKSVAALFLKLLWHSVPK